MAGVNMEKNKELRVFAEEIRVETLKELANLGFGHIGGSMSVVELLAVLYGREMRIDPQNPQWEDRVLKGCNAALPRSVGQWEFLHECIGTKTA